jgi:hypothetical protein
MNIQYINAYIGTLSSCRTRSKPGDNPSFPARLLVSFAKGKTGVCNAGMKCPRLRQGTFEGVAEGKYSSRRASVALRVFFSMVQRAWTEKKPAGSNTIYAGNGRREEMVVRVGH